MNTLELYKVMIVAATKDPNFEISARGQKLCVGGEKGDFPKASGVLWDNDEESNVVDLEEQDVVDAHDPPVGPS